jgi:hypothetical protein
MIRFLHRRRVVLQKKNNKVCSSPAAITYDVIHVDDILHIIIYHLSPPLYGITHRDDEDM